MASYIHHPLILHVMSIRLDLQSAEAKALQVRRTPTNDELHSQAWRLTSFVLISVLQDAIQRELAVRELADDDGK